MKKQNLLLTLAALGVIGFILWKKYGKPTPASLEEDAEEIDIEPTPQSYPNEDVLIP